MSTPTKQQKRALLLSAILLIYTFVFVSVLTYDNSNTHKKSPSTVLAAEKVVNSLSLERPAHFSYISKHLNSSLLSAKSIYVTSVNSKFELYDKNSEQPLPIASLTKLMAALVVVENYNLESLITVPLNVNSISGSEIFLAPNDQLSVRDLLTGALVASGNDAIYTLATNFPGGVYGFVSKMNEKARELGLQNTFYTNPIGYDETGNVSSAKDLAKVSTELLRYDSIKDIASLEETSITGMVSKKTYRFSNTNHFISLPEIIGLKTGTSPMAKENLILVKSVGDESVIIVIVGSDDRNQDAQIILDWLTSH